jgi:hypothetical protein
MKKILILNLLLFAFGSMFAQKPSIAPKQKKSFSLPKSLFNLDVNYNIPVFSSAGFPILAKAMIGSNNTGIIIGLQDCIPQNLEVDEVRFKGFLLRLGYQKSIVRGLFCNLSADFCRMKGTESDFADPSLYIIPNNTLDSSFMTSIGWRLNTGLGYTVSLGKAKRIYLNTETIFSVIDKSKSSQGPLTFFCGMGYRFGSPAKTSYDGIKNITTVPLKP